MLQKDFNPVLRFMVVSDVHYKDEHCVEEERMEKAIKIAYRLAVTHPTYKRKTLAGLFRLSSFVTLWVCCKRPTAKKIAFFRPCLSFVCLFVP